MPRVMSRDKVSQIERLIDEGHANVEIGRMLGVHNTAVRKVRRGKHSHQTGLPFGRSRAYEPTREEIDRLCLELRRKRVEDEAEGWMPQTVCALDFGERR